MIIQWESNFDSICVIIVSPKSCMYAFLFSKRQRRADPLKNYQNEQICLKSIKPNGFQTNIERIRWKSIDGQLKAVSPAVSRKQQHNTKTKIHYNKETPTADSWHTIKFQIRLLNIKTSGSA